MSKQVAPVIRVIASETEIVLESAAKSLDLANFFGRKAPLQVDLGCGDGSFLSVLAQRHPDKNFLGIERLLGRIRTAAHKAATLGNVRLLHMESSYAVRYLLSASSVEIFYLLFPDPWPKRRHWRRRIFTRDFLGSIAVALEENGLLRVATDQLDYFEQIERVSRAHSEFEVVELTPWHRHPADVTTGWKPVPRDDVSLPLTKFERRFRAQGMAIHWLELRKVSPVR